VAGQNPEVKEHFQKPSSYGLVEKMRSAMLIGQKDESFFSLYPDKEKGIFSHRCIGICF
jgi:hypothetical protein